MLEYTDRISIETTHNVRLDYEVASVSDRMIAWFIDTVICAIYIAAVLFILDYLEIWNNLSDSATIWLSFGIAVPVLFYDLISELIFDGQSIGKRIRNIKVIKLDGTSPSFSSYFIRWVTRLLENVLFFGLGFVAVLASAKGQRLGDIAAGTAVATVKKRVSLKDTILHYTSEDYTPTYPQVTNLTSRDIETIKYVLNAKSLQNLYYIRSECAKKVCEVIGIECNIDQDVVKFLQTIVDDYTYYRSQNN